ARVAFTQTELELRVQPGWQLQRGGFSLFFGPELGAILVMQGDLPDGRGRVGLEGYAGGGVEARFALFGPVSLYAAPSAGVLLVSRASGLAPAFRAMGSVGVAFEL